MGTSEEPREYDREFTTSLEYRVRRRIGYSHDRGTVTRFVVQVEYRLDRDWWEIVRFDHDPEGEQGHDVTTDGVHTDVYRDGEIWGRQRFPRQCPRATLSRAPKNT